MRWQSTQSITMYRTYYKGDWQHLPRTLDFLGDEVIDISGNPGRMTMVRGTHGMRLWASQDIWFGPASAAFIDPVAVANLAVGTVTPLDGGGFHVRLWDDGATVEQIRNVQQQLRTALGYDDR